MDAYQEFLEAKVLKIPDTGFVPMRAVMLGRKGLGVELSEDYFADGCLYMKHAELSQNTPTLFDLIDGEAIDHEGSSEAVPRKAVGQLEGEAIVPLQVSEPSGQDAEPEHHGGGERSDIPALLPGMLDRGDSAGEGDADARPVRRRRVRAVSADAPGVTG